MVDNDIATLSHYLTRYAEPEAQNLPDFLHSISENQCVHHRLANHRHCVVIPTYNESTACVQRFLDSPLAKENVLLILVVNQPDSDINTLANRHFWDTLLDQHTLLKHSAHYAYLSCQPKHCHLLLVNRFNAPIPAKQGVGLARKIGGDIACQFIAQKLLKNTWVHHTDADTHLPNNYFSELQQQALLQPLACAGTYAYQHRHTTDASHLNLEQERCLKATLLYEEALNYYVKGLRYANSPYAYHTLGSCIAIEATAYCKVRGFPKKSGGEDFYLLNKLAKVGHVLNLTQCTLTIEARLSTRVPFGTGPAVEKILAMANPSTDYVYYHPQCFHELKQLLEHFSELFRCRKRKKTSYSEKKPSLLEYEQWLNQLSDALQDALKTLKIEKLFSHIDKQIQTQEQCLRHCHEWLDGFRTLKLIHLLEQDFPNIPLSQCTKIQWY